LLQGVQIGAHSNQVLSRRQHQTISYCNFVAPVFICYWRHAQVLSWIDRIVQTGGAEVTSYSGLRAYKLRSDWYQLVSRPILVSATVTSRYQQWIQDVTIDRFSSSVWCLQTGEETTYQSSYVVDYEALTDCHSGVDCYVRHKVYIPTHPERPLEEFGLMKPIFPVER
jgi:hypothetical protein